MVGWSRFDGGARRMASPKGRRAGRRGRSARHESLVDTLPPLGRPEALNAIDPTSLNSAFLTGRCSWAGACSPRATLLSSCGGGHGLANERLAGSLQSRAATLMSTFTRADPAPPPSTANRTANWQGVWDPSATTSSSTTDSRPRASRRTARLCWRPASDCTLTPSFTATRRSRNASSHAHAPTLSESEFHEQSARPHLLSVWSQERLTRRPGLAERGNGASVPPPPTRI